MTVNRTETNPVLGRGTRKLSDKRLLDHLIWRIRSSVKRPMHGASIEAVKRNVLQSLARRGATNIVIDGDVVRFSAERVVFFSPGNPLAYSRSGLVCVTIVDGECEIDYDFDVSYLLWNALLFLGFVGQIVLLVCIATSRLYPVFLLVGFISTSTLFGYILTRFLVRNFFVHAVRDSAGM